MFSRSLKLAIVGTLFFGLVAATSTSAAATDSAHVSYITFNRVVTLPGGAQLAPGTYRFELAGGANSVVRITGMRSETVYLTAFTQQVGRPTNDETNEAIVTLAAKATTGPAAISAWYPIGESMGHQFVYANK